MSGRPLVRLVTSVDNRGDANGMIGLELAARSPADGYTVMLVANTFTVSPSLFSKVPLCRMAGL